MTVFPSSRGRYSSMTACIFASYFAMTASTFAWMRSSKRSAILRRLSRILVGPKKLNSSQGIPYFSSITRHM